MWSTSSWIYAIILISYTIPKNLAQDVPCRAIPVNDPASPDSSILCECTADYCDTVTRQPPTPGTYVVYTTSREGKRFERTTGTIEAIIDNDDSFFDPQLSILRLVPAIRYQHIEGFGGSVTDAASINWRKLSYPVQTHFINSYFGSSGLEYNLIRVPIAGSDFSTHPYTYNEEPVNDHQLTNYTLSIEDYVYKLPMITRSLRAATAEVKITASTWSPPVWMKTNGRITGFAQLIPEFYQSYADYHLRFIQEYEKADVKIWGITTTNEPINGIFPFVSFNSLGWFPHQLGKWVAENLGPTIKSAYPDIKIMAVDDQRYLLSMWMLGMEAENPRSLDYIDGIAVHYYGNFAPASILDDLQARYPNKFIMATEACEGAMPWDRNWNRVELGSWRRARRYTTNIMEDLNHFVVGWIDWNLCLDENGGPNWADNFVDAPILVYGNENRFVKQPMFYAMGHFSKFIPRDSQRIHVTTRSLFSVDRLTVINPEGNYVVVLHNGRNIEVTVRVQIDDSRQVSILMEPESIATVEINPNTIPPSP